MIPGSSPPKISVITPVLNGGRFIEDAIRSVLRQEYPQFEHVVVDGGSTDGTVEILKRYPHLRWMSEPDGGQSDAMNKGFRVSDGEIIVYLNADDYFEPEAFWSVVSHFLSGAQFVVGRVNVLRKDGSVVVDDPKVELADMLRWWEPNACSCNPVGYFYLRQVQESVKGFNIDNNATMDIEFLLEAARRYQFTKIKDVLGTFRLIPGTKTYSNTWHETLGFCDRYLEYFDDDYVRRYVQDRVRAKLELAREAKAAKSVDRARLVRRIAQAVRHEAHKAIAGLREWAR